MNDFIENLLNTYGVKILGATYFDDKESAEMTEDLEKLYKVVKGLIREHDKLARNIGKDGLAILEKRGRKAETETAPTTTEDVYKRLVR